MRGWVTILRERRFSLAMSKYSSSTATVAFQTVSKSADGTARGLGETVFRRVVEHPQASAESTASAVTAIGLDSERRMASAPRTNERSDRRVGSERSGGRTGQGPSRWKAREGEGALAGGPRRR